MNSKRKITTFFGIITIVVIAVVAGVYTVLSKEVRLQETELTSLIVPDSEITTIEDPKQDVAPKPTSAPAPSTFKADDIEDIRELLKEQPWVRIIVALVAGNEFKNDTERKTEIKKIQDAVLVTLDEKDFLVSHQYQNIPSFAGRVSESGLEKLLENPYVLAVSLDIADPTN